MLVNLKLLAAESIPLSFTIAAPISAPFAYLDEQGKNQGFLVEFFSLVSEQSNIKVSIDVMPWARGMHEVKVGRIDSLMPAIYTKKITESLVYPNLPIVKFHTVLLKRKEDDITVDDITTLGTQKIIAKIRAMSMGKAFDDAQQSGKINVVEVRDFDHAIQMLAQSRVDLVACIDYISKSSLKRLNLRDKIDTLKFSNEKVPAYLIFSRTFAEQHDVNALMTKIAKVKTTLKYQKLVDKFLP